MDDGRMADEPRRGGPGSCFTCGEPGHYSRDCPLKHGRGRGFPGPGRGGFGGRGPPGPFPPFERNAGMDRGPPMMDMGGPMMMDMGGRMDSFGGGPMGPPMMRDEGPNGMPGRGDHGPPMMHHSLPGPPMQGGGRGRGRRGGYPEPSRMGDGNGLAFGFDAGPPEEGPSRGGHRHGRGRRGSRGSLTTGPSRGEQNDYCQHFVDTGGRPQNFLRDVHLVDRYEEYPKMRELIHRKDSLVAQRATPAYFMQADLRDLKLDVQTFGTRFDIVLVDPPWEEYARRAPGIDIATWTWQEIMKLEIEAITDTPSFLFLWFVSAEGLMQVRDCSAVISQIGTFQHLTWCGSAEGLDAGRHCLKKWGFRRCEDICWIKSNAQAAHKVAARQDAFAVLQHTKEHCLMGIRGTVRRSQDSHVIHSNVDTDIIVAEEFPFGSTRKPDEMYSVIEHFCLGRRRLELFGEDHNIRPGWVTVGSSLVGSNFNPQVYGVHFADANGRPYMSSGGRIPKGAPILVGSTDEIEELRPKSPPPGGDRNQS